MRIYFRIEIDSHVYLHTGITVSQRCLPDGFGTFPYFLILLVTDEGMTSLWTPTPIVLARK